MNPHRQLLLKIFSETANFFVCNMVVLFVVVIISITPLFADDQPTDTENKAAELESVRSQIKDVESEIQTSRNQIDDLQLELRINEITTGDITLALKEIKKESAFKKIKLNQLNTTTAVHEKNLAIEREKLARQIRAAYITGKGDYLKLLLNQEDPATVGRILAYYDYHNRARTEQINLIKENIEAVEKLQTAIQLENEILQNLTRRQLKKRDEIEKSRERRQIILIKLQDHLSEQGTQLQSLQQQEKQLTALLDKLGKGAGAVPFFEDIPPFNSQKGKLKWPVKGKLLNRFGNKRKGGNLKWQGVKIDAALGTEVRAISTGKVVFADWFRNLGLLMILDHGEGYMSLYGYNQSLLKKPGDWVVDDEVIAYAGDTGGQRVPSVYFEIRHRGEPLNPVLWCKK
jgi:septal ring factor EnvC (AmiA/AmiB activator)